MRLTTLTIRLRHEALIPCLMRGRSGGSHLRRYLSTRPKIDRRWRFDIFGRPACRRGPQRIDSCTAYDF